MAAPAASCNGTRITVGGEGVLECLTFRKLWLSWRNMHARLDPCTSKATSTVKKVGLFLEILTVFLTRGRWLYAPG